MMEHGASISKGENMQNVRELRSDEIHVFHFSKRPDLEKFVFDIVVEDGRFDYEILSDNAVAIPESCTAWCRDHARRLSLEFTEPPAVRPEPPEHSDSVPSKHRWDALMSELEQELQER